MADLNALIAQGVQFQAPPDPFAQYAQMQQLQQGAQANQLNQMKMQEYQRGVQEHNALRQLNPAASDYEQQLFRVSPKLGIEYRKEAATAAAQKATEDERLAAAAAARQGMLSQAQRDISSRPSDANITAHMEDVLDSPLFKPEEKASVQKLSQTLLAMPIEDRGAFLAARGAKPSDLMAKPAPVAISPLARLQKDRQALLESGAPPNDPRVRQFDAMIAKETTHAPGTTVNVSTEKKYGEAFGTKIADRDVTLLDTASKAPELAANADRVMNILKQGNVFTGSAADIKLNLARVLNIAGANNNEKIANTEMLMSGLARNTLGAVKSSGLGSGQGFTDKDLQFLQDAEGGRITLNAQSIQRLAELSRSAAEKSADAWNTRVKQIPASAVQGTGLSTEPIAVPKRAAAPKSAPVAGAVQDGYKFKGGDPAVQSNWEKI